MSTDPTLEFLDRLDAYWQTHQHSPELASWIAAADTSVQAEIASELLLADLEYRYKQRGPNSLTPDQLIAVDYLSLTPLAQLPQLLPALIEEEFFLRARDDSHAITTDTLSPVAASITADSTSRWRQRFANVLAKRHPLAIRLHSINDSETPILNHPLGDLLEIGRATQQESTGPRWIDGPLPRLVVSHCRYLSISRHQIRLQRSAYEQLLVVNQSRKVPIKVIGQRQSFVIPPRTSHVCEVPFTIKFDQFAVRLQTAQSWRPNR